MFVTQFGDLGVAKTCVLVHVEAGEDIANWLREGALHHEEGNARGGRSRQG